MSQPQHLHTSLLRPCVIHILRAAGFHSTKPSVLDTLVNIAERHLLLLASTAAAHARSSHNALTPGLSDVRMALADCGVLAPILTAEEEGWRERMRRPLSELQGGEGGEERTRAMKRKREEEDAREVQLFERWVLGPQNAEIRRVAGILPDKAEGMAVGVGGEVVQGEDYLAVLRKRLGKAGEEGRLAGTVLGRAAEERPVFIEGGPVGTLAEWEGVLRGRGVEERVGQDQVEEDVATSEGTLAPEPEKPTPDPNSAADEIMAEEDAQEEPGS